MNLLTYEEAADQYHCSKKTLEREIKAGRITAYRPGKFVMLCKDSLDRWIKSKKIQVIPRRGRPRKPLQINFG